MKTAKELLTLLGASLQMWREKPLEERIVLIAEFRKSLIVQDRLDVLQSLRSRLREREHTSSTIAVVDEMIKEVQNDNR